MTTYKTFIHKTDFTEVLVVDIPGEGMFLTDSPGDLIPFEPSESWVQETEFEIRRGGDGGAERRVSALAPMSKVTGEESPGNYGSGHIGAIRDYLDKYLTAELKEIPGSPHTEVWDKTVRDRITDLLRRAGIIEKRGT